MQNKVLKEGGVWINEKQRGPITKTTKDRTGQSHQPQERVHVSGS